MLLGVPLTNLVPAPCFALDTCSVQSAGPSYGELRLLPKVARNQKARQEVGDEDLVKEDKGGENKTK